MNWKPIKTAPRDGRRMLCCNKAKTIFVARFNIENDVVDDYELYRDPTHWMPLPEPPQQ